MLPAGSKLFYQPRLLGAAKIHYSDSKSKSGYIPKPGLVTPITDNAIPVLWENAEPIDVPATDLEKSPHSECAIQPASFHRQPGKKLFRLGKRFRHWLYGSQRLDLLQSPSLKISSNPGEDERDFRIRLQQIAREQRDEMIEDLREKYASKLATLQERKRKAEQAVEKQAEQAKKAKMDTALSVRCNPAGRLYWSQSPQPEQHQQGKIGHARLLQIC